jgi:hypothetical protein
MITLSTAFSGTGHQTTLVGGHGNGFVRTTKLSPGNFSASTTNHKGDTLATSEFNRSLGHKDATVTGPLGGTTTAQANWSLGHIDASITGPLGQTSTFEYNRSGSTVTATLNGPIANAIEG